MNERGWVFHDMKRFKIIPEWCEGAVRVFDGNKILWAIEVTNG
jgi:hypothetical protein